MRQPVPNRSAPVSQPASTGPPTDDSPMTGPKAANAVPTSFGGNIRLIMPRPCGSISAPNRPWATREPTSMPGDWASPHSSEAAVKPAAPTRNMRRRPYRSPSRPPVIRPIAMASV
ncbi:hypothetical protein GCM10022214_86520 [Actinomadura miaoliensis]|uniref:Uncharacterized protein n=1 Tax=Actinomadura miaoliensis TaxID=430685 RepID=A0ABP7X6M8_9ACTN